MSKSIKLTTLLFFITLASFAQVGIGTTTPDASSALDITATDKGFLMPRMTTAQRTAIASPAAGLQAYDTDTKSVWFFDGTVWKEGTGGAGKFVDGSNPLTAVYNDGNVAIGAMDTPHRLQVFRTLTTDVANTGVRVDVAYNGTGNSTWTYGLDGVVKNLGIGSQGRVSNENAGGSMGVASGSSPQLVNAGTITDFAAGISATISNSGSIPTSAVGSSADITNNSGGHIDDAFGGFTNISNEGTINSAFGMFVDYFATAGTVTNSYGIYISEEFNKGTTDNFSLYSGSNADSFFQGNVGIGIRAPQQKVHISGAMRLEPQATAPAGGALGDLYVNTDGKLYFHNGTAWKEVQLVP